MPCVENHIGVKLRRARRPGGMGPAHSQRLVGSHWGGRAMGIENEAGLRPATADEIAESLSFSLRYAGRKRVHDIDEIMSRITAERLVKHLEVSGFVILRKPPGRSA